MNVAPEEGSRDSKGNLDEEDLSELMKKVKEELNYIIGPNSKVMEFVERHVNNFHDPVANIFDGIRL